jgi:hypothetical protein
MKLYHCTPAHVAAVCQYNLSVELAATGLYEDAVLTARKAVALAVTSMHKEVIFFRRCRKTLISIEQFAQTDLDVPRLPQLAHPAGAPGHGKNNSSNHSNSGSSKNRRLSVWADHEPSLSDTSSSTKESPTAGSPALGPIRGAPNVPHPGSRTEHHVASQSPLIYSKPVMPGVSARMGSFSLEEGFEEGSLKPDISSSNELALKPVLSRGSPRPPSSIQGDGPNTSFSSQERPGTSMSMDQSNASFSQDRPSTSVSMSAGRPYTSMSQDSPSTSLSQGIPPRPHTSLSLYEASLRPSTSSTTLSLGSTLPALDRRYGPDSPARSGVDETVHHKDDLNLSLSGSDHRARDGDGRWSAGKGQNNNNNYRHRGEENADNHYADGSRRDPRNMGTLNESQDGGNNSAGLVKERRPQDSSSPPSGKDLAGGANDGSVWRQSFKERLNMLFSPAVAMKNRRGTFVERDADAVVEALHAIEAIAAVQRNAPKRSKYKDKDVKRTVSADESGPEQPSMFVRLFDKNAGKSRDVSLSEGSHESIKHVDLHQRHHNVGPVTYTAVVNHAVMEPLPSYLRGNKRIESMRASRRAQDAANIGSHSQHRGRDSPSSSANINGGKTITPKKQNSDPALGGGTQGPSEFPWDFFEEEGQEGEDEESENFTYPPLLLLCALPVRFVFVCMHNLYRVQCVCVCVMHTCMCADGLPQMLANSAHMHT